MRISNPYMVGTGGTRTYKNHHAMAKAIQVYHVNPQGRHQHQHTHHHQNHEKGKPESWFQRKSQDRIHGALPHYLMDPETRNMYPRGAEKSQRRGEQKKFAGDWRKGVPQRSHPYPGTHTSKPTVTQYTRRLGHPRVFEVTHAYNTHGRRYVVE